jgi:tetratricopeptide (TPR) repeat protein
MMELGRMEEAEAHYRKAFELMPDSFGRMESHCFGCEHAFEGERAQTIAEKVFSALAEKSGAKPQVYYLLGYLREEQERYQEAAGFYKKAFTLDPDYINALKRYRGLSSSIALPVAELDKATFELIRLDPGARHVSGNYDDVHDLKGLWQAVTKSQSIMPESPKSLYLLKASSAALDEKEKKTVASQDLYQHHYRRSYGRYSEARTPDSALKQVGLIRSVLSMLASD